VTVVLGVNAFLQRTQLVPPFDTFSKRQKKRETSGQPDVYQYDDLPRAFRNKVIWIWRRAIGPYFDSGRAHDQYEQLYYSLHATYPHSDQPLSNQVWDIIARTIAEEAGQLEIGQGHQDSFEKCAHFLLSSDAAGALDIIDLSFHIIDNYLRDTPEGQRSASGAQDSPDEAIRLLNLRFKEHNIGYEFLSGVLIRVDDQYIHQQVVKPALALLSNKNFKGPNGEFLRAHEHYRKQEYKDAIVDAGNAFESTMKAICDVRKWQYSGAATASTLIKLLIAKGLLEDYYESILIGLSTLRNKTTGAHGQGSKPVTIPQRVAAYALHLAAANILVLVETHNSAP
jgi:AbiJ N-terminal domain 4